jgi:predicted amidohydrolase
MRKYLLFFIMCVYVITAIQAQSSSFRADFSKGNIGALPDNWKRSAFQQDRVPNFVLKEDVQGRYLFLTGGGDRSAVAYISTTTNLAPGTYEYKVLFSISDDVNPQRNLLFQCRTRTLDGIFSFYKLDNGMIEGRETIVVSGNEAGDAELRIYYRFNPGGEVKIRDITITPVEPVQPRWARFACTQGQLNYEQMRAVAEQAAKDHADLLLFPEMVSQRGAEDAPRGEEVMDLMAKLAVQHKIYVGGSVYVVDKTDGKIYNRGVLYDRAGQLAGVYDKIHPYSPESTDSGLTSGLKTAIFETDFGKVGMIICYDSWFTDVTQLFALKGAEVILFPVAGYFRSLIHARCADNQVRFVISVLGQSDGYGIFDTAGRDVQNPDKDPTVRTSAAQSFKDIRTFDVNGIGLLCGSLDLNCKISPHYNQGTMREAPGGKRNRDDQIIYLDDLIKQEKERWWKE